MIYNKYTKKLKKLLNNIPKYNYNDYSIVIFGTGNTSVLYQKCFENEGIKPVYYLDNNESKQGNTFHGVQIISINRLNELQSNFNKPIIILICSTNILTCFEIQKQLNEYRFKYSKIDAFIFSNNKEKLLSVMEMLEDDFSKEVYYNMINSRINNLPVNEKIVNFEQYFTLPQFLKRSENEIFLDIGAYVGDTIEIYINKKSGVFKKIYAFEPDEKNYMALKYRVERINKEWGLDFDKIEIINAGVGKETEKVHFTSQNENNSRIGGSFSNDINNDSKEVTIYSLDDYFKEQKVSFIKADIESYELDMLKGAENVIKRDKPLLYVCIYHNASDMFTIPLFLKSVCSEYKIKIRQLVFDCAETIMYAYI